MPWDTNWAATEARGKLPRNVLNQLRAALAERASVVEAPPELPPLHLGKWDSAVSYTRTDAVDRDMIAKGAWSSATSYVIYDYVTHEDDRGSWSELTAYTKWQKVAVDVGGVPQYYIASASSTGQNPIASPSHWWPIAIAPPRTFRAIRANSNKSPHTEILDWQHIEQDYLTFIAKYIFGNLNKDPLTQASYWDLQTTQGIPLPDAMPGAAWFATFQSAMTGLFPKYANHQTNGGDYEGLTAIPVWSEADMLTAIGDTVRIPAPGTGRLTAAWAWQQYRMINLLRWAWSRRQYYLSNSARQTKQAPQWQSDWPTAVGVFKAASWIVGSSIILPFSYSAGEKSSNQFTIGARWVKWDVSAKRSAGFSSDLSSLMDLYLCPNNDTLFQPIGSAATKGVLTLRSSHAESVIHADIEPVTKAEIDGHSFLRPGDGTEEVYRYCRFTTEPYSIILKFTGPNGFTYRDWV